MRRQNVFVFGLNDFNRAMLERVRGAGQVAFHRLLDRAELVERRHYPVAEIIDQARERLRSFDGPVDGIIHYIDFPVSTIVPIIAREFGLPSASLEAVLTCEHKYWSRVEQARCIPEHVPPFTAFDPRDAGAVAHIEREVGYPCWVKPVKSFSSYLGFRAGSRAELEHAIARLAEGIDRFAAPFDHLLEQVGRPPGVAEVGGGHCLAEGIIGGRQCTLEGYVYNGETPVIYGAVDSIRQNNRSSFGRFQYPSRLPRRVLARMREVAVRFMRHVGYDNAPFNIEFFWDQRRDRIWLLEVNTRISESHCDLFEKVDGSSNQEVAVDLALGRRPQFRSGEGEYPVAGKFFLREYGDRRVTRVPSPEEIRALEARFPGLRIQVTGRAGEDLSALMDQDSYSYCLAMIFIGGNSQRDILDTYRQVTAALDFEFAPRRGHPREPAPRAAG